MYTTEVYHQIWRFSAVFTSKKFLASVFFQKEEHRVVARGKGYRLVYNIPRHQAGFG
jgi:hypothetical protein